MRRIDASGGIELGPTDGPPWIDVVPMAFGRRVEMEEVERTAMAPQTWWTRIEKYRTPRGTAVGLMGVNREQALSIRFLRPARQRSYVDAMRRIAEVDPIPPAVAGGILTACAGLRYRENLSGLAPGIVAHMCSLQPSGPETEYNNSEIEGLADKAASSLAAVTNATEEEPDITMPTGSVDRARFWLAVSRRMWSADILRRIGREGDIPDLRFVFVLGEITAVHALLLPSDASISLGKRVEVNLPDDELIRSAAWPQVIELAAGDVSSHALFWLSDGSLPPGESTIDAAYETEEEIPPIPDADMAAALARQFLQEAKREGVYAPAGAFVVDVPNDLHLAAWGVRQLKIWCEPDCLWCGTVDENGEISCIFQWSPGSELRSWIPHEWVKPALEVTLAALWRDLRVGGEKVFPAYGSVRRGSRRSSKGRRRRGHSSRSHAKRSLPGKRYVLEGRRTWGSEEERETIRRRAHGVRGHLRKLPEGWQSSEKAVELAREYDLSLPDGYTFVRPHVRGRRGGDGGEAEEPETTVIQARGLLSLTTLLDSESTSP